MEPGTVHAQLAKKIPAIMTISLSLERISALTPALMVPTPTQPFLNVSYVMPIAKLALITPKNAPLVDSLILEPKYIFKITSVFKIVQLGIIKELLITLALNAMTAVPLAPNSDWPFVSPAKTLPSPLSTPTLPQPPLRLLTINTLDPILVALLVPLASSLTPTFFTFVNSAVHNAQPVKTTPKSVSMPPHALPTSFSWTVTAVVWLCVPTDFTPTPRPRNAPSVIPGAVCVREEV